MSFSSWTVKRSDTVLEDLGSSRNGLSDREAKRRLQIYGKNEIDGKKVRLFDIFLSQFKSPFSYLLIIAAFIAFLIGEIQNSIIILFFVFINVFFGFFQEVKAQRTLVLLKKYFTLQASILRKSGKKVVDKRFLVPGDVVIVEAGDLVPADIRLLESNNLLVDESLLTGESVPVSKTAHKLSEEIREIFKAQNIIFAGTSVVSGWASGVVIYTGMKTELGALTRVVGGYRRESIYEKNLIKFSRFISRIVLITIVAIFIANVILKKGIGTLDFLIFSIALIIGIIPEVLPTVVAFSLARGAFQLSKKKVIVRRLSAIEDLGNIEILCVDKTGTLTENELVLEEIVSAEKEKCLLYALLSMPGELKVAFDKVLFNYAPKSLKDSCTSFKVIKEVPFDSVRMRSSVLVADHQGNKILITKGAPDVLLDISTTVLNNIKKNDIKAHIEQHGYDGKRTLGIAFKPITGDAIDEKDFIFLGYFSFVDPIKKTAIETLKRTERLGVAIKILTGDSKEVASFVSKKIGLIEKQECVITGGELQALSSNDFEEACLKCSVFARISPYLKSQIIETLQKKYVVGFLGEGINDTPALKVADVSIVVQEAVDIAREVADIILLKKDLNVLILGIYEGRKIFSNINKYVKVTLSSNFGNYYSMALISLIIPFLPILPIQILLINVLSDFPMVAITSDNVDIQELKRPKMYQLSKIVFLIIFLSLISTIFDFIFFGIFYRKPPMYLRTLWFVMSILTEIVLIFSLRTPRFFLRAAFPGLPLLGFSLGIVIIALYLPFTTIGRQLFYFIEPSYYDLFLVIFLLIGYFWISEMTKLMYFKYAKVNNS